MSANYDDLEREIKEKDEKINQLEKTTESLEEKHESPSFDIDNLEQ